jgi:hypothetical protein
MDVKWKRKKIDGHHNGSAFNLVAVLVGNHRKEEKVDGEADVTGQLGIIAEKFLYTRARDMRAFHQGLFWARVDKKLNKLGISVQDRKTIEAKISETVPRPGEDWALWSVTCIPRYDP